MNTTNQNPRPNQDGRKYTTPPRKENPLSITDDEEKKDNSQRAGGRPPARENKIHAETALKGDLERAGGGPCEWGWGILRK